MDSDQDKGSISRSPRKLIKRAKTWEMSDSDTEEESPSVEKDDTKATEAPRGHQESLHEEPEAYLTSDPDLTTQAEPSAEIHTSTLPVPLPGSTTPSPNKRTRRRKNPEDLEADRIRAEERRKEKEAKKLENERRRNQEKEEKEKRKESAMSLKLLRPEHCGKYMTVQLDAGLLQDAGSEDLLESLRLSDYNHSIEPHLVPYSVTWKREMPGDWTCVEGLELCRGEEDVMLILVEPKDFLTSVQCHIQAEVPSSNIETPGSVFGYAKKYPHKKITLVILGLRDFHRNSAKPVHRSCLVLLLGSIEENEAELQYHLQPMHRCQRLSRKMERHSLEAKARRDPEDGWATWRQIDEALVFLQLYHNTEVINLDTWKQLGEYVCAVTKSVAQRPFRLHCEAQSHSFCTSVGSWRGWGPRGSLTGLPLVWKRQIQQLNRVSPAMAATITEAYPSPQLLMQAYAACNTEQKKLSLLSDLRVPRNTGATEEGEHPEDDASSKQSDEQAGGRDRRIGPDLSRRIYMVMAATNPELVLDLNS